MIWRRPAERAGRERRLACSPPLSMPMGCVNQVRRRRRSRAGRPSSAGGKLALRTCISRRAPLVESSGPPPPGLLHDEVVRCAAAGIRGWPCSATSSPSFKRAAISTRPRPADGEDAGAGLNASAVIAEGESCSHHQQRHATTEPPTRASPPCSSRPGKWRRADRPGQRPPGHADRRAGIARPASTCCRRRLRRGQDRVLLRAQKSAPSEGAGRGANCFDDAPRRARDYRRGPHCAVTGSRRARVRNAR